jgi:hypothetical protein
MAIGVAPGPPCRPSSKSSALSLQYRRRVVRDVTADIALRLLRMSREARMLGSAARDFVERMTGTATHPDRLIVLRGVGVLDINGHALLAHPHDLVRNASFDGCPQRCVTIVALRPQTWLLRLGQVANAVTNKKGVIRLH